MRKLFCNLFYIKRLCDFKKLEDFLKFLKFFPFFLTFFVFLPRFFHFFPKNRILEDRARKFFLAHFLLLEEARSRNRKKVEKIH